MIDSDKRLTALLPMKAHSARVTSKNFRPIAGKPLFRWILETLVGVDSIDEIVINTDARAILAENGLNDGDYSGKVKIRNRKPEICGDLVSMNRVIADDVQDTMSDYYLMTHTTNPLLQGGTIIRMLNAFIEAKNKDEADSLFAVNRIQTRFYKEGGSPINHDPNNLIPTQDLEPYFEENSLCYLFTPDSFKTANARIGRKPLLFETPKLQSVDIDEQSDWFIAESLLMRLAKGEALPD